MSYHDVIVRVNGEEHKISKNYAYILMCTKVGGWQLFKKWGHAEQLIGGEFDGGEFIIEVKGVVICDSRKNK